MPSLGVCAVQCCIIILIISTLGRSTTYQQDGSRDLREKQQILKQTGKNYTLQGGTPMRNRVCLFVFPCRLREDVISAVDFLADPPLKGDISEGELASISLQHPRGTH